MRETANARRVAEDAFDRGLLLGVLIGEGHFGGDRLQPQVTIKMHVAHKPLLEWLSDHCPGSRLYGPYENDGRRFYQLMIRGNALRYRLIPLLDELPLARLDPPTYERYVAMKRRYGIPVHEQEEGRPQGEATSGPVPARVPRQQRANGDTPPADGRPLRARSGAE